MSKIMDADKIIIENIEPPGQDISPASIDQNDQQCFRQKIGKRKRIYSLTVQEDGQFSFLETEDEENLIPKSWKDNSYAIVDKNTQRNFAVEKSNPQCFLHHVCIENCKDRDIVPEATSTPKRKREKHKNGATKVSFQSIGSLSRRSTVMQNTTNERSKLIANESQVHRDINESPPLRNTLRNHPANDTTYGSIKAKQKRSSSYTYCVHGNKYGFSKCCKDLHVELDDDSLNCSHDVENNISQARNSTRSSGSLEHCHTERENGIDKKARRKLVIASIICLIFMVVEVVGGILANSLAIATDAAHLLTDLASFMISLFSIWLASRPSTQRMSFGWHRAEVIGATISVLLIWVVTGILVYTAILRITNGNYEVDAKIMLITSGIGVGVNIIMGCSLHQHHHTHEGQNNHADLESGGTNPKQSLHAETNINVKAAFIHVIGDFVQSLGVFSAALIMYFKPEWRIVDPICTFIFSVLVLGTTISILRNTMNVLMEGIPENVNFSVAKDTFLRVPGIVTVHNLRIWGLTTDKTALSAHLVIDPSRNPQDILKEASTKIREKYNIYEMTLQVEEFHEDMDECTQCQDSPER